MTVSKMLELLKKEDYHSITMSIGGYPFTGATIPQQMTSVSISTNNWVVVLDH